MKEPLEKHSGPCQNRVQVSVGSIQTWFAGLCIFFGLQASLYQWAPALFRLTEFTSWWCATMGIAVLATGIYVALVLSTFSGGSRKDEEIGSSMRLILSGFVLTTPAISSALFRIAEAFT